MSHMLETNLLKEKLLEYLREDVGFGDSTTNSVVPPDLLSEASITSKSDGIVAGIRESLCILQMADIEVLEHADDGAALRKGQTIIKLRGLTRSILTVERTLLNILMKMSGIATLTRRMVDEARSVNPKIKIACTRKTTPGFRLFEKRAVEVGGGDTHRLRLDDSILVKSNHILAGGGVESAVARAKALASFTKKIEVEATSSDQAILVAKLHPDILMLDNMSPSEVEQVLSALDEMNLRTRLVVEVSGGVTPETVKLYARLAVDVISMGMLTHSARALDINLRITRTFIKQ